MNELNTNPSRPPNGDPMILTTRQRLRYVPRYRLVVTVLISLLGILGLTLVWVVVFYAAHVETNELLVHGVHASAVVMDLKPNNHNEVMYVYEVDGRRYTGDGPADGPDGSASELSRGQSIHIVYSSWHPALSCYCDASADSRTAQEGLFVGVLLPIVWLLGVMLWTLFGDGWTLRFVDGTGFRWVKDVNRPLSLR